MKFIIGTEAKFEKKLASELARGKKLGADSSKTRIENLEKGLERKDKEIDKLKYEHDVFVEKVQRETDKLRATIKVYQEERDKTRDVVKQQIENDDLAAELAAKKDGLDRKEAKLKDRETRIGLEEDGEYKHGYADGVADGIRKISEITQKDRDGAMKIAMVAAGSHSTPEMIKESANVLRLTEGTTDQKTK